MRRKRRAASGEKRHLTTDEKKTRRRQTDQRTQREPREAERGTTPCFWRSVAKSGACPSQNERNQGGGRMGGAGLK
ncbi:hypothetical protein NDU88_001357 [Pleurodeles waltl]|uniref:Uncharacterized protein n=1 Tax=Pleurodeles waltl TaxID=8319 RepID=A0AAV7KRV7_PLEWA|nr:hypothetical protein NDU88_001357 [Pleurodeles waltl]